MWSQTFISFLFSRLYPNILFCHLQSQNFKTSSCFRVQPLPDPTLFSKLYLLPQFRLNPKTKRWIPLSFFLYVGLKRIYRRPKILLTLTTILSLHYPKSGFGFDVRLKTRVWFTGYWTNWFVAVVVAAPPLWPLLPLSNTILLHGTILSLLKEGHVIFGM